MSNQAAIRPYEMSVWTLRDTFLASLRVPGIENKGQIEEPKMRLNTDGTQELSFKIPMYMYNWVTLKKAVEPENEEEPKFISTPAFKKIENPRWYDVKHGLLMVGLRKIKVIFNKGTADEDIYEFLVTDITEEHADDNSLYCNVNCSGLAFQELGKKGYNISLSADTYYLDYDEAIEQQKEAKTEKDKPALPINNINYWCDKVFKNSDWEYSIQMDWATYDGFILHRFFKDDIQLPDGTVTVKQDTPYIGYINKDTDHPVYISSAYTGTAKLNDAIVVNVTKANETTGEFPNATDPFVQERFITYTELLESERDALNYAREKYGLRRNDKIYEDDYTASWDISDKNVLTPTHYEKFKEKRRMVESNESNIYNATQAIAEAFGVYCQYKYHYDNNYHIIKKEVIFYNDFMDELHGIIDLSYNYDVSSITRTLDSNDICTKLIVRSVDDDTSPSGKLSIMNTPANKTGENYLLNFDYLYQTGSIEKDQYEAIPKFELEVKKLNKKLITLEESKMRYEREINEYEATIAIEKPSIVAAEEQVEKAYAGLLAITKNETGTIEVMPKMGVLLKGENGYYINISTQGVIEDTILVYKECYGNEVQKDTLIKREEETTEGKKQINYQIIKDNTGNIIRLDGFKLDELQAAKYNCYYLKYSYRPELYYENIINTFSQRSLQSQQALEEAQEKLEVAQAAYDKVVEEYDNTLEQKQELIADFEKMMGPALREGTWQPDTYDDYGDYRASNFRFTSTIIEGKAKDDYIELKWDDEPFDEEQLGYYELGSNQTKNYYPCIQLDNNLLTKVKDYLNNEDLNYTLQFKYDEILSGGAVQESENNWTQTWNNTPYSAPTLEELENKILLDKLIAEGYVAPGTSTLNTATISDHILLAARQACGLSIHSPRFLTLGSEMTVGFLQDKTASKVVTPVLVLLGAEDHDINFENNAMLCISSIQTLNNDAEIKVIEEDATTEETRIITDYSAMQLKRIINPIYSFESEDTHIIKNYSTDYTYVYPRLYIKDMSLKTSEDQLKLSIVGTTIKNLQNYYDYNLLARDDGYYITIEGQRLIENGNFDTTIHVDYVMSNAELNIYLDALEVMQSSAFPQVSYSVTVSMLNEKFMHKAYRHLNRIAHINDFELKFENVLGYIAELNLDLDHPWEDTIDVKNYKTKFEDLFTKIVASTEQMKANATVYNKAAAAFNFAGGIKSGTLNDALSATSLSLAFTKGNLTIDDKEGIRAESQDGIVMMNGGGIFCATEKNNSGDWIWNSGILPTGINASLLKAGTIDTNLIRIYAGDNLRFQMNANGLYAYRAKDADEADQEQYVVHNSDGLFLIAEAGTKPVVSKILTKLVQLKSDNTKQFNWPVYDDQENFTTTQVEYDTPLKNDVQRVEVSWDGLKLRNWEGKETFYADPDTGDLIIGGTLLQNTSYITVPTSVMDDINKAIPSEDSTNDTMPKNSLLRNNIRLLGEESNSNQVKELSNNDYHSLTDYVINELVNDAIRLQAATTEEAKKNVEQNVRFLTPKVAAVKIGNYINWSASSISNEILRDAINTGGRIDNRIQEVTTILQTNINNDYIPILSSLTNMVDGNISSDSDFPPNPQKYQAIKLTENRKYNYISYSAGHTYWWDGENWIELLNKNINLSTNQELNLFGAKATFATGSELKMLAGGKLHLFGGEVFISSQKDLDNITTKTITEGVGENKITKTIITTKPTTNGIVMDDNGLAIYSTKNITIGTQRVDANENPYVAGLEIDGSTGSFSVVTDAIMDADKENNKEDAYKDAGINFYRINEDRQKVDAIIINGNGITVKTDAKIDIESTNFRVHSTPTGNQPIFYVGADNGEFIQYQNNELTIKGKISADALILNSDGTSQAFGETLTNLQNQIDGEIDSWSYQTRPVDTTIGSSHSGGNRLLLATTYGNNVSYPDNNPYILEKAWELTWLQSSNKYNDESLNKILRHNNDIFTNINSDTTDSTAGYSWRFVATKGLEGNITYYWLQIADTIITAALNNITQVRSEVAQVANGTTGISWSKKSQTSFLNKDGLKIIGSYNDANNYSYFKVQSDRMGFEKVVNGNNIPLMYYENGDVYFSGKIYADSIILNGSQSLPNGKAPTIDNYLSAVAQNTLNDALQISGINGATINGAITERLNAITGDYNGTLANLADAAIPTITSDTSAPKTGNKTGDIFYNTSTGVQSIYNGSEWVSVSYAPSNSSGDSLPLSPNIGDTYTITSGDDKGTYIYTGANNWENLTSTERLKGAKIDIDAKEGTISLKAQNNIAIQSGGTINLSGQTISLLAAGTNGGAISLVTATGNNAANNVFTLNNSGITIGSAGNFIATAANTVYIGTKGTATNPDGSYLLMGKDNNNNKFLKLYTTGELTVGSGGKMTIGASSGQEATLSLLSTGKLTAYGAEEVIIATGNASNKGSYLWMYKVDTGKKDEQQQTIYEKKLDIGTSGDFEILSGGSFKAIAAKDVLIATSAPDNNEIEGSYLWMHDVKTGETDEHQPIYTKKLDIGTTGDFTVGSGGNFTVDSGNINMTTSSFALNIVDQNNNDVKLMSITATGSEGFDTFYAKSIKSESIVSAYTGPSMIYIGKSSGNSSSSSTEGDEENNEVEAIYCDSLNAACELLNNSYLKDDVIIQYLDNVPIDSTSVNIYGILGTGVVTIKGHTHPVTKDNGDTSIVKDNLIKSNITITGCTALIQFEDLNIQEDRISIDVDNPLNLIELKRNLYVKFNNCVMDGNTTNTNNNHVILIRASTSQTELNEVAFSNASYGLYQTSGTGYIFNCVGDRNTKSWHIEKSILFNDGSAPGVEPEVTRGGQVFLQGSQSGVTGNASNTATIQTQTIVNTEPVTESFKVVQVQSARNGRWTSDANTNGVADVMQGCYDSKTKIDSSKRWWYGCMWFDLTSILNQLDDNKQLKITSCSLKLRRQGSGGTKAERPLYIIYDPYFISTSANAKSYTNLNSYPIQTITAGLIWGQTGSFNIDTSTNNFKQMFNDLINSTINDKHLCLILYEDKEDNERTSEYSTGYSRYYGKVSGYEPTLTLTYQIVDKQS